MSDTSVIQSFDESAANMSFSKAAGTIITSPAVGAGNLKAVDECGDQRVIELTNTSYVPQ